MPRYPYGYGSRYRCPDCRQSVNREDGYRRYGAWSAHTGCTVTCALCEKEIEEPAIGSGHLVAAYCGEPVHSACKAVQ